MQATQICYSFFFFQDIITENEPESEIHSKLQLKRRFLKVLKSVEISFEINVLENFEIDLVYFRLQFRSSITVFQYLRQLETSKQFFFFKK